MRKRKMLREDGQFRKILDVFEECPGIRVSTAEIAIECEISNKLASAYLFDLNKRGYINKEAFGRGKPASWWVEA